MNLVQEVFEAGRNVGEADGASLPGALSGFLSAFIGRPYASGPAVIEGPDGQQSEPFAGVVATAAEGEAGPGAGPGPGRTGSCDN